MVETTGFALRLSCPVPIAPPTPRRLVSKWQLRLATVSGRQAEGQGPVSRARSPVDFSDRRLGSTPIGRRRDCPRVDSDGADSARRGRILLTGGPGRSRRNAARGVRDRRHVERELAKVIEGSEGSEGSVGSVGSGVFKVFGVVETEVEAGCFGRGGSLGRTLGVGVERVQH